MQLNNVFNKLKIDEKKVLQYFIDKANYSQLPHDQRQLVDDQRAAHQRAREIETNSQAALADNQRQFLQAHDYAFRAALNLPDIKHYQSVFDKRAGDGAFAKQVMERGSIAYQAQNKYISPEEASREVMKLYGPIQGDVQVTEEKIPVIPNIKSKSSSPVSPKITSIAQLKELSKTF